MAKGGNRTGNGNSAVGKESLVRWWSVRYRFFTQESGQPEWHFDTLIAHQIIKPIIATEQNNLLLWRVHRRYMPDEAGHQFSFKFYSSRQVASRIFSILKPNILIKMLKKEKIVRGVLFDDLRKKELTEIGALSDKKNWPEIIQDTWPYYIDGVSRCWLKLVETIAAEKGEVPEQNTKDLLGYYQEVDDATAGLWQNYGGHAYLHHLHAVFGWVPVLVNPRQQFDIF